MAPVCRVTYLELVRRTAQESGTIPDGQAPASVQQGGRAGLVATWVRQAWLDIQNAQASWLWMRDEWTGALEAGRDRYSPADLGAERFGEWLHEDEDGLPLTTIYLGTPADEARLHRVDWLRMRSRFGMGDQTLERPGRYAVDPQQRLVFHPMPDAAYTVRGLYRRGPQTLTEDGDTPEMPERFHFLIVLRALLSLATYDEAPNQMMVWQMQEGRLMGDLRRDQLPMMRLAGGPLA